MVHVVFDANSISIEDVLEGQSGGSLIYEGYPYQRGYGVQRGTGFLRNLLRFLMPSVKSVGRALAKEGLSTGSRILGDLSEGKNFKESVIDEGRQGVKNLVDKAHRKMSGSGKRTSVKRKRVVGRLVPKRALIKRRRVDNLGFY